MRPIALFGICATTSLFSWYKREMENGRIIFGEHNLWMNVHTNASKHFYSSRLVRDSIITTEMNGFDVYYIFPNTQNIWAFSHLSENISNESNNNFPIVQIYTTMSHSTVCRTNNRQAYEHPKFIVENDGKFRPTHTHIVNVLLRATLCSHHTDIYQLNLNSALGRRSYNIANYLFVL